MTAVDESRWVREPTKYTPTFNGPNTEHLDGIPWYEAPLPKRWHRCKPQTRGWIAFRLVERCPCGAIRHHGLWGERNTSRKPRTPPTEPFITRKQREADEWKAMFSSVLPGPRGAE